MKHSKNNHQKPIATKLMILACTIMGFAILWLPAYSQIETQTDSLQNAKETEQDTVVKYLTPMEYALMMHEETSWLFKIDFPAQSKLSSIKLGIEKMIAPSFSLNLETRFYTNFYGEKFYSYYIYALLESRWYYRMNKRVREDKVARNMSDNYLALGLTYLHSLNNSSYPQYSSINVFAKWGFQRRFLKYGHVDFGMRAGAIFPLPYRDTPILALNNFFDVGLAFTKDKYKLDREKLCPILKCYDADKFIIKSNLISLFAVLLTKSVGLINIAPHIAFEQKIGKSGFSVNVELRPQISYYFYNYFEVKGLDWNFSTNLLLEGRWYYNLKRRILKGKTGNGLSANYLAAGGENTFQSVIDYSDEIRRSYFYNQIYITTGMQHLYSKHMYFDVNVGLGYILDPKDNQNEDISLRTRFALGYRF